MQRAIFIPLAATLLLAAPRLAFAEDAPAQITVSLVGIDTSTEHGADRALRRIRHAAEDVCDVRGGLQPYSERASARECVKETMTKTVASLGDPMLAARFGGNPIVASR